MVVEVGPETRKKLLRSVVNGLADMQGGRLPGGEKMLQVQQVQS